MADPSIEETRQHYIQGVSEDNPEWRESFKPGTFGCHEALDRTSLIANLVDDLSSHPAILSNPKWFMKAHLAAAQLYDLYQAIGAVHLHDENGAKPSDP